MTRIHLFFLMTVTFSTICSAPSAVEDRTFSEFTAHEKIDTSRLGRLVLGLSFEEVRTILLNDTIYEGRMRPNEFHFRNIRSRYHPFSLYVQAECIIHSNTTATEKDALWNLFLYRNFAKIQFTITSHYYNGVKTGESLSASISKLDDLAARYYYKASLFRKILPYTVGWSAGAFMGFGAGALAMGLYKAIIKKEAHSQTLAVFMFLGALVGHQVIAREQSVPAAKKLALELLEIHKTQVNATKQWLPEVIISNLDTLQKQIDDIQQESSDLSEKEKFKEWFEVIFDYYSDLELHSDPTLLQKKGAK